ncbi:MAG: hypothetical protein IJA65_01350 [Acholeplasmatales bacterium]|nr:hypothetical protein [Acholeplasmatales bacterium]
MDLENELDRFLKIKTTGRDDTNANFINFPYEATPYSVLQVLSNSGYVTKKDKIIDFGSGKGRVDFYLAYNNKAKMIGVEYDERLYNTALENHKNSISSSKVDFINICASKFIIPIDITGAYFFNPFSIDILKEVINNIRISKNKNNREIKLFFYYPSNEYLEYLNNNEDIIHIENLDCMDLFKNGHKREYIAIYKI